MQHYKLVRFNNISKEKAFNNLLKQQKRDEELRIFCKNNNIILLELHYNLKENEIIKKLQTLNDLNMAHGPLQYIYGKADIILINIST